MKYVSEQFKEKQNQIIRPPLKVVFELGTDVANSVVSGVSDSSATELEFDDTVAPVVAPSSCSNEYYYAVVGENKGVDDPNSICAPDNSDSIADPTHSVPYGITEYTNANTEALIGNSESYVYNFTNIEAPMTLSFRGGVIPDVIRVEVYDNGSWVTEKIINNSNLSEEISVELDDYSPTLYHRFWVKNTTTSGRFQLNWIRADKAILVYFDNAPVRFENDYISSVNISEGTDLTSQNLPSYEMTVACIDPDGIYNPDSEYWDNQFSDGTPCYIKAGYEINGSVEYVPLLFGNLSEKPKYEQNKITFKVAVNWRTGWITNTGFDHSDYSNVGDELPNHLFWSLARKLFDSSDVFDDMTDRNNSVYNYHGDLDSEHARQLVANALGCYIVSEFGECNIYPTKEIQYKETNSYVRRYDQVKCSLENKQKVGIIKVTKNRYTVSSSFDDIEATERKEVGSGEPVVCKFLIPFYPSSKMDIVDMQSTVASANVSAVSFSGLEKLDSGDYQFSYLFSSDVVTTIQPILRFYRINTDTLDDITKMSDSSEGDVYTNNNQFVTNNYIVNKVRNVARLVNGMSKQYEVEVVQNLAHDIGDIIGLETQKGVFKTCVITGLKFNLPGSKGQITCRGINLINIPDDPDDPDSPENPDNPNNPDNPYMISNFEGQTITILRTTLTVLQTKAGYGAVGVYDKEHTGRLYVTEALLLNVTNCQYQRESQGDQGEFGLYARITETNGRTWDFSVKQIENWGNNSNPSENIPYIRLPDVQDLQNPTRYREEEMVNMIKELYEAAGIQTSIDFGVGYTYTLL